MRRARATALWICVLVAGLWWSPALTAMWLGPARLREYGIEADLHRVRPDNWFGLRIARAELRRADAKLQLTELRVHYSGQGIRVAGRLDGGTFEALLRADGSQGVGFVDRVPLEPLQQWFRSELPPLRARGAITGAARWSNALGLSLRVEDAQVDLPILGILDLGSVDSRVTAHPDGRTEVDYFYALGPAVDLWATGQIIANREVDLEVEVAQLDPRLDDLVRRLRPDLLPLPTRMKVQGYTSRPEVIRLGGPASDAVGSPYDASDSRQERLEPRPFGQ